MAGCIKRKSLFGVEVYLPEEIPPGSRVALFGDLDAASLVHSEIAERRLPVEVAAFISDLVDSPVMYGSMPVVGRQAIPPGIDMFLLVSDRWREAAYDSALRRQSPLFSVLVSRRIAFLHRRALVSHKGRFVFYVTPKVASRSIAAALSDWGALEVVDGSIFRQLEGYFIFTFCRNPWSRLFSAYGNKRTDDSEITRYLRLHCRKEEITFGDFVRYVNEEVDIDCDPHWRSQQEWLSTPEGDLIPDFIGRFETIDEDFREVCRTLGIRSELPHLNWTGAEDAYRDQYTATTRAFVARRFARDIELFNYSF